jgi:group I intron endonuclease
MHYIYRIVNVLDGKIYIGQSNKEIERWRQHKYFARQENPIQYVHRAMKKYGVDNFVYEIIAVCKTQEDADYIEELVIKQCDSRNKENGYNIALGGNHAWNAGLPVNEQPMYGKHHTKESKKKISDAQLGVPKPLHTEQTKKKMSESGRGKPKSKEWKQKHSGENHHLAKLTTKIVAAMRKERQSGATLQYLAVKYEVTKSTVGKIINNQMWAQ